ncbi:Uncharacterized membrane protein [Rhizobiales bacterium GAS191]|jgi:uncharacterized membrane protein|nr:Uncharacterized membrane protein [Rhizobiales bacterium GAS191]
MKRDEFLHILRDGLAGLPAQDIEEILADYTAHFDEARAAGRAEEDVARALGEPARLARELRAEAGLRRFEEHRNPANFMVALLALCGLAAVDLIFLFPVLLVAGLVVIAISLALLAIAYAGAHVLVSGVLLGGFHPVRVLPRLLVGVGLIAGTIGGGAVLLLCSSAVVRLLGRYARLHYRLLKPTRNMA